MTTEEIMPGSTRQVHAVDLSYPPRMSQPTRPMLDAEADQSYPATDDDGALASNLPAGLAIESHLATRRRRGWVRMFAAVICLVWLVCPAAAFAQNYGLTIFEITGDGIVDTSEKLSGFEITGTTGNVEIPNITVTLDPDLRTWLNVESEFDENNIPRWSVTVEADASYITHGNHTVDASYPHPNVNITVSFSKAFVVDLTPAAPMNLTAETGEDRKATLSWDNPGNSTITNYQYRFSTDGGSNYNDFTNIPNSSASTTNYTKTGLTNGTNYTFQVRAQHNDVSGEAATTTATPLWPAPTGLVATPGQGRVILEWTNNKVSDYIIHTTGPGVDHVIFLGVGSGSTATKDITGLTNGEEYTFHVRAQHGKISTVKATPASRPAPENFMASDGDDRETTLSWNDPTNNTGNNAITKYEISIDGGETFTDISGSGTLTTGHTETGLTNGTEYTLKVRAVTGLGRGAAATATVTPLWPAPTDLVATPGEDRVTLEWTTGNNLITRYYVETTGDDVSETTTHLPGSGSKTTAIIDMLTEGAEYTFEVWAEHGNVSTVTAGPNAAPTADAGADRTVDEAEVVTLSGSGTDPEGAQLTYAWTAPAEITLSDATAQSPTFTAPTELLQNAVLEFTLTVNDTVSDSAADTVVVTVTAGPNDAPRADAGADRTVGEAEVVTLSGSGTDPEGAQLTYAWTAPAEITLSDATAQSPTFTAPTQLLQNAVLEFTLTVNDTVSDSAADTVVVTVTAGPNDAPTADAGADRMVEEEEEVTLSGSGSRDPEGAQLTYAWTAPAEITLSDATAQSPTFTAPTQLLQNAVLEFTLTVNDTVSDSAADTVVVTVTAGPNDAPTADAGADRTVEEEEEVTLSGSGSRDPEGAQLTYAWTAPAEIALSSSTAQSPTFTAPAQLLQNAVLEFTLRVNDTVQDSAADTVVVTVTAGPNDAPRADAGADRTVEEEEEVTLSGSGSRDPEGAQLTYAWTAPAEIALSSSTAQSPTFTAPAQLLQNAVLEFTLRVNDTVQDSAADTVVVTVTAGPAPIPDSPENLTATSGDDRQTTLSWTNPGDNTIYKYQVSMDGGATFTNIGGSGANTTTYNVTGLTNGTGYTLAVRAVNNFGPGEAATMIATPLWPAPADLVATPGQGRVTLEWTTGNNQINQYYVETIGDDVPKTTTLPPGSGSKTTEIVYPLTNGNLYTFKVRAQHGNVSTVTARPVAMPAPENLTATSGDDRQTTLSWTDPGNNTIYKYQVSMDGGTTFTDIGDSGASTTTYTVTDLTNGAGYTLAVRAVNYWGYGAASTATATPLWPAPANLVATPDNGRIYLEWDRNPGITDYRVETKVTRTGAFVGSSPFSAGSGSKTIAFIDELTNGAEYTFTVLAAQGSTDSSWPATVNATPRAVLPDAPTNLSAAPSNSQVTLSWDDPGNNTITKYQVSSDGGTFFTDIGDSGASTTTTTVTELTNGAEYTFAVRAVNASGDGAVATTTATPVNDAPTASHNAVSTDEDTAYTFVATVFGFTSIKTGATLNHLKITALPGPNQGTLSVGGTAIASVSPPRQVTKAELDAGQLKYTPPANANGAGLATFGFKVNDGVADSKIAYTITINVNAVNDPITGSDKRMSTDEDEDYTFGEADFAFSDVDAGAELNHVKITALPGPNQGTLSVGGTAIASVSPTRQVTKAELDAGQLKYTPPANANGVAFATFDFKVSDGTEDSAEAYTITIDVNAVNDPPVTMADIADTSVDIPVVIGVLENDTDVDAGTALRVVALGLPDTVPRNGTVAINPNMTNVTYTPNANVTGADMFGYSVTDGIVTINEQVTVAILQSGANANLSNLTISSGTLTPDFAATIKSYAVRVEATTESVTVTPTTADVNATVTVKGRPVASGSASGDIALIEGEKTAIAVVVTAEDGTTIKTYTIGVRRSRVPLRVAITSEATAPVGGAFEVTIAFSKAVTGFERSEITVTNGTVSSFSGSGTSYTVEIAPSASGPVTVEVGADVAEDGTGNGNLAAAAFVIEADLTGPEVEIASEATAPVGGAFEVTIAFSETVTGFEQSEITVTNGTVSSFSESETSYTVEIAPSASGPVTVEVGADVARDGAGNGNRAAEPLVIEADLERPEVTIAGPTEPVGMAGFEVRIAFSEPVTGFELEDIQVTNGTASNFTKVSPQEYTVTITPEGIGEVRVEVPKDVAEDRAGNGNEAAEPFEVETKLVVSYQDEDYTATEGGETVTVTVKLSQGWDEELAIPIRVTRPEATEAGDYTVEDLEEWDAQEGTGRLTFPAEETEQVFTIEANHDGDGDDESVQLAFGTLPTGVVAGSPATATVTLADKGLLELTVRFAQVSYEVKEGEGTDIAVTVSPAVDRRVEVPLVVAPKGGATDEDYSGVPAKVVFEEGESEGAISVEVLADEVNDPGEGIVLSFGEFPEAVIGGEISQTTVNFRQHRTAEQFSQTLEAMLAVMARSMGESAQTAIEGRFERHRQWSRLGSSGGAMQMPQPESGHRAAAPSSQASESIGSGAQGSFAQSARGAAATGSWNAERRKTSMPRSRLRNVSLGLLGSVARSGQTSGSPMEPRGSVYGQDRPYASGLADAPPGPVSVDFSAMRDRYLSLSRVSFERSLGENEKETSRVPVLWGQGDLQRFNGDLTRLGMDYRGGLEAAHVGLDLYANDRLLAGASFMRSRGEIDYTDDGVDGVLESRMNTVHPYLYWQPSVRVSVWGIGGMGAGQVDVTEPGRMHAFDADFRMLAAGVRTVLTRRGNNEWGLRADAFATQLGTGASEDIEKASGEAHRGRLMLEWVHDRALSPGRSLSLKAEAGGRLDGGAADRGAGVETGFRLGYLDANSGLDVGLQGRVLVVHESDYRDWGVSVQASWDPGEKQRGFRASAMSSSGQDGGGRTTLWDNADAVMRPAGMGSMGISRYRTESEVAYAGMKAPGVPGLLTPYSRLRWSGQGRELAVGTAWNLTDRTQLALPATLELEGVKRESVTGRSDRGLTLRMSIPF